MDIKIKKILEAIDRSTRKETTALITSLRSYKMDKGLEGVNDGDRAIRDSMLVDTDLIISNIATDVDERVLNYVTYVINCIIHDVPPPIKIKIGLDEYGKFSKSIKDTYTLP